MKDEDHKGPHPLTSLIEAPSVSATASQRPFVTDKNGSEDNIDNPPFVVVFDASAKKNLRDVILAMPHPQSGF